MTWAGKVHLADWEGAAILGPVLGLQPAPPQGNGLHSFLEAGMGWQRKGYPGRGPHYHHKSCQTPQCSGAPNAG